MLVVVEENREKQKRSTPNIDRTRSGSRDITKLFQIFSSIRVGPALFVCGTKICCKVLAKSLRKLVCIYTEGNEHLSSKKTLSRQARNITTSDSSSYISCVYIATLSISLSNYLVKSSHLWWHNINHCVRHCTYSLLSSII